MQRCCSFCRIGGHRINNCNDERLNNFDILCRNYINNNGIANLKNFLLEQATINPNLIKAFAIKNCNNTTRHQIDVCIESIVEYFTIIYQNNLIPQQEARVEEAQQVEPVAVVPSESQESYNGPIIFDTDYILAGIEVYDSLMIQSLLNDRLIIINRSIPSLEQIRESLLLMEMINIIRLNTLRNRKFNIKTEIIENQEDCLEEKCDCDICYESCDKINFIKLNCKHEFCKDCLKKCLQNETKPIPCCAFCRTDIETFELRNSSIKDEFMEIIENI
jgi:hypothetical protein